jgi:TRAP-type uncharacterized transport system substrate-binding protein
LTQGYPPLRHTLKRALDGMPVPLHPGAEKFFKEKGLIK